MCKQFFYFMISFGQMILFFIYLFNFFKRSPFHIGTIVNFVSMRQFKVCLSVYLNICLGYKSRKNLSVITKFGYVFAISNLCLHKKICDLMIDTFYRDTSVSQTLVIIYAPLLISLCNSTNVIKRTTSISGF